MKVKRKKEEENNLTKKVGVATSAGIGGVAGGIGGYVLSEAMKGKDRKKAEKMVREAVNKCAKNETKEQIEQHVKEQVEKTLKVPKRRIKYVLPAAGIGAVIGGVGYKEITKRKGRNRRNEDPETK